MFFYFTTNLLLFFVNILDVYGEENVKVMSNKEAYNDLKRRLSSIKESCGEVCDQTIEGNNQRGPSMSNDIVFLYLLPRQSSTLHISSELCTHAATVACIVLFA